MLFLNRHALIIFVINVLFTFNVVNVQAGWLDKLNTATQKISEKAKHAPANAQPKTSPQEDPDRPLHLEDHYKGSCEGKRSATCLDYGELASQCMDPLRGYRAKLTADLIEKKLKSEAGIAPDLRQRLQEDLEGFREAEKNRSDEPTIAGQPRSQRYLSDISEEDQVYINAEYDKFYKKIYNKCVGADHMGIGKRTEMMQDTQTISGEQAVAELRKKKSKESAPFDCLKNVSNIRWTVMAEMMEAKMKTLNLSEKDKSEWEADIASIRQTADSGAQMPTPADPANPTRYMLRLTGEEQVAMMQEYSARSQAESAKCTAMSGNGRASESPLRKGGLVDRSKSPANKKAPKPAPKKQHDLYKGIGGTTNLLALRRAEGCFDPLKGHLPKITAEKLEAKLKATPGLSDQKRKEWEEDIAAYKSAAAAGLDRPDPVDPQNPYRADDYLTKSEWQAINAEHAAFNSKIIKECNSRDAGL